MRHGATVKADFKCCYQCEKRVLGCHATCEDYKTTLEQYRKDQERLKAHEQLSMYQSINAAEWRIKEAKRGKKKRS